MESCIFCEIVSGRIPAHVIYEDNDALAFLDIHPKAPGHTVVISKVHAPTLAELPGESVEPLFAAVQRTAREVRKRLRAHGLTIGINEGDAGGQAVGHLHVHILPRFRGDGGGSVHSIVENPSKEPLEAMRKRLYIEQAQ